MQFVVKQWAQTPYGALIVNDGCIIDVVVYRAVYAGQVSLLYVVCVYVQLNQLIMK